MKLASPTARHFSLAVSCVFALMQLACRPASSPSIRGDYWKRRRQGTNFFNQIESSERFANAARAGIRLVRLAPDKWQTESRDFLIGDADNFHTLVSADLKQLKQVLSSADRSGVKVVLTMLTLPGARWRQHNNDVSDYRLYREERFQAQAAMFWRALAFELKGHPAIVGYNILNEPVAGTGRHATEDARALNRVYASIVGAIREVDQATPILLDSGNFAAPSAFESLEPVDDPNTIYAFHFYEPWEYVNHRNLGRWSYPGKIPRSDSIEEAKTMDHWDREMIENALSPVLAWQLRYHISDSRIFAEEFGLPRTNPGAHLWLTDLIDTFVTHNWHWAFYSYQEDTWSAMDYELGDEAISEVEKSDPTRLKQRRTHNQDNAMWQAILRGLAKGRKQREQHHTSRSSQR